MAVDDGRGRAHHGEIVFGVARRLRVSTVAGPTSQQQVLVVRPPLIADETIDVGHPGGDAVIPGKRAAAEYAAVLVTAVHRRVAAEVARRAGRGHDPGRDRRLGQREERQDRFERPARVFVVVVLRRPVAAAAIALARRCRLRRRQYELRIQNTRKPDLSTNQHAVTAVISAP